MTSLFVYSYLLPASVVLLALWAIWRIVRLFDLTVGVRQTLFVQIGTLGFSSMLVPTATITSETGESVFGYTRGQSPPLKSCSDSYFLMRCSWSFDAFDCMETLRNRRVFEFAEEQLALEIEFKYDRLRDELRN